MASRVASYAERSDAKLIIQSASGCLFMASDISLYTGNNYKQSVSSNNKILEE